MTRGRFFASGAAASLVLALLTLVVDSPAGHAAAPAAVVPGVGDVFVADTGNNRVVRVTTGGAQTTVGSGFSAPRAVAVDPAGNVYVADTGNNRVVKVPADGGPQVTVGTGYSSPRGLAIQAGSLFVVDYGNNQVVRVSLDGSSQVQVTSNWIYGHPIAVATGPDTNSEYIWITLENANTTFPGKIIKVGLRDLSSVFIDDGGVRDPGAGLAVDPSGRRFQTSIETDQVIVQGGTPLGTGLNNPQGVNLSAQGDVVAADTGNSRVVRFPAGGGAMTTVGSGFSGPVGVAVYAPPPTFTAAAPPVDLLANVPYSYTFAATAPAGTPAPVFQHMGSNVLPTGFTVNSTTGAMGGTPQGGAALQGGAQGYTFLVAVGNAATYSSVVVSLTLRAVRFTADSPPGTATVGTPYSYTFHAAGDAPVTYAARGGFQGQPTPLPAGLSLDPATGVVSGTPTTQTTYMFQIRASNPHGYMDSTSRQITVGAAVGPPSATVTTPANGATFTAGSVPNAGFTCTAGANGTLKAGTAGCSMKIDGGAAVGSGTALAATVGSHTVVVTATQTDNQQATVTRSYTVMAVGPSATVTSPANGATFVVGSVPNAAFSCAAGAGGTLKAGTAGCSMKIDGGAAVASGTPLAATIGAHTAVVTATQTDNQLTTVTRNYTVKAGLPSATVTSPANGAAFVAGSVPNAAFSCAAGTGGTLQAGTAGCSMKIDGGAAIASGTALVSTVGNHTAVVTATQTDNQQHAVTRTYTVVARPPTLTVTSPTNGATYPAGSVPAAAFSCAAGAGGDLNAGLSGCSASFDGGSPAASGAPLPGSTGPHTVKVTVTQTDGQTTNAARTYTVAAAPPPASGTAILGLKLDRAKAKARAGKATSFALTVSNTGTAAATGVKVCVVVPKSAHGEVKKSSCQTLAAIAAGQAAVATFRLKATKAAAGTYKLTFTAVGAQAAGVKATAKLKVVRRADRSGARLLPDR